MFVKALRNQVASSSHTLSADEQGLRDGQHAFGEIHDAGLLPRKAYSSRL